MITPTPISFLRTINLRHLFYILKGIIDSPHTYFKLVENLAFMWVSEICRTIIDRFIDPVEYNQMYELAKKCAVQSFGVTNRIFPKDPDKPLFFYGLPDNELAYHEIPDQ